MKTSLLILLLSIIVGAMTFVVLYQLKPQVELLKEACPSCQER